MANSNKYSFAKYNYPERWISYWHQINEVAQLKPESVLEIGPGNNFVTNYLRSLGFNVKTVDNDKNNNPDIVSSAANLPLENRSFDLILCADVLEHLPFDEFPFALAEINRVAKRYAILSLPHWGWLFYLKINLPLIKPLKLYAKLAGFKKHQPGGEHFWEIGKAGYPLKKIKSLIEKQNFKIIKEYLDPESPYHHFFILEIL